MQQQLDTCTCLVGAQRSLGAQRDRSRTNCASFARRSRGQEYHYTSAVLEYHYTIFLNCYGVFNSKFSIRNG